MTSICHFQTAASVLTHRLPHSAKPRSRILPQRGRRMKQALVIGANEEAVFSIETAHRYGLLVAAMDGNPKAKGLPFADEAFHVDINDLDAVFEVTDRLQPCAVVPAPIGHCLTTIGAVNDRYHLIGVSEEAAKKCTDKYRFHQEMAKAGLRKAEMLLLRKGTIVRGEELSAITRFPVVVKPRLGSGSRGVEICGNEQELRCLFQYEICGTNTKEGAGLLEDYIVETCIPGPEYGVDGAYVDGEFRMVLLRRKKNTPPPYRQCVGYYSVLREEEPVFYEKCCALMQKMGEVLGFENCVVHADLIRMRNEAGELTQEPFVIETSARPSGHNLSNLFTPLATGVTLVEDFLKLAVPEPAENRARLFRPERTRKLLIRYFDLKPGRVTAVPDPEALKRHFPLLDYVCSIRPGDELSEVTDGASVMGRGYYILEGESNAQLDEADERLRQEFSVETNAKGRTE